MKSKDHPSADMMFQVIRKELPNISFDTVNRTLLTFSDIGLLEVLEVQGGPRRYEPNHKPHHHFYCQRCGEIIDLFHSGFGRIQVPEDIWRRFDVRSSRIVLSGLCDRCRTETGH
jgi:Fur family peroxide stress response transcriptional regulator